MEILEKVKSLLPEKVVSKTELEGSEIIIYTNDKKFFRNYEEKIREVVKQIKKRIEIRAEKNLLLDKEEVKKIIQEIVPKEAEITNIYFEPERSTVIIAGKKPGLIIGKGGETFRRIKKETFWSPRIERMPSIHSDIVIGIRKVLHKNVKFRKKFLNEIGKKIFSPTETKRNWIRIIGLGGWGQVGRSCILLESLKSKVLIDCGINVGGSNSNIYPILNTKEFDLSEIDAVIISHAHLDHCLHPSTFIQLPNGEILEIGDFYNKNEKNVLAFDFKHNFRLESRKVYEKCRVPAPSNLLLISTSTKKIKVTPDHLFFTFKDGKIIIKKARDLKVGDFIPTVSKISIKGRRQKLPTIFKYCKITKRGRKILRKRRKNLNLTQSEVAKLVGCTGTTISAIELGKSNPRKEILKKILKIYKLQPNIFFRRFVSNHLQKCVKIKLPKFTTPQLCQFLGYLLGDGCKVDTRRNNKRYARVQITDKNIENLETYQKLAKKIFRLKGKIIERERKRLVFYSPLLLDFINAIDEKILCKSPLRSIPSLIQKITLKELASFMKGLFDAEGSVTGHRIVLTTSSYKIAEITKLLLLRFGILSHLYKEKNTKTVNEIYKLQITYPPSIKKFASQIGFSAKKKMERLLELEEAVGKGVGERVDLVPFSQEQILKLCKKFDIAKQKLRKNKISYYHYSTHHPSRKKILQFLEILEREKSGESKKYLISLKKLLIANILWEKVKNIEKIKADCKFVYDLKIPGHNNYVANGIIVHNCGFVPYLVEHGYDGPIYMTVPTLDLFALLCLDYIDVMQKSANSPLYTAKGVKEAVKHTITLDYNEVSDITPDIRLTFQNAGHILGSALIHLHIGDGLHNIVYALDQKFGKTTLLDPAFTNFRRIETLIIESTYGGRNDIMPPRYEVESELMSIINKTMERKGIVLIPSFSVERAQEVMAILVENEFQYPVFLDGMIWDANGIFTAYPEYLSKRMQRKIFSDNDPFLSPIFKRIASKQEREKAWNEKPCVIISTSGMLVGGPVIEHLKMLGGNENNTLIFVGYQAEGTLGKRIQKGWREIPFEENGKVNVLNLKMEVKTIEGLSGHSDRNQLLGYVGRLKSKPNKIIVVHGEYKKSLELANSMKRIFRINTLTPKNLEAIRLK